MAKGFLQRQISSLLRPWLQQEADMVFELGIFRCCGFTQGLELNASALNSALMESSPLLIQTATVEILNVEILPWRNPVLTVEIHGLHVILRPRLPDDKFWESHSRQQTAEQKWKDALVYIDPQGSAAHAAAERVTKIKSSRNWFTTVLADMALQCTRIELHDISVDLQMPMKASSEIASVSGEVNDVCHLRSKHFIVEDGFSGHNKLSRGILSAAVFSVLFSHRLNEGSKNCSIEAFGIELKRPELSRSHSLEVENKDIILFRELMVSVKLRHLQLVDLEVGIPEVRLGLYPRDLTKLMIILEQLTSNAAKVVAPMKSARQAEEFKHGKNGRELWRRALEKVNRLTSRHRLQYIVEIFMLRQRYVRAYGSWLREIGWGKKNGCMGSASELAKSKDLSSSNERLWKEVSDIEDKLPVEVIALARRVARHNVLAHLQQENVELNVNIGGWKAYLQLPGVLALFPSVFVYLWNVLGSIYAFLLSSCSTWVNVICSLCPFIKNGHLCQPVGDRHAAVVQTHNFCTSNCSPESKSFNMSGSCYRVNFCKASITIACDDFSEIFVERNKQEAAALSSGMGPSICLILEDLYLAYASDENAMEFCVVCGEFKGHIFYVFPNEQLEGRDSKSRNTNLKIDFGQKTQELTDNYVSRAFLWSTPALQIHCLHKNEDTNGGDNVSNIWDVVLENHQAQMWSDWENKNIKNRMPIGPAASTFPEKPFLLSEVRSFLVDPSGRDPNTGLLKWGLSVGKLICDLESSDLAFIIHLLLQLLDASQWNSISVNKKLPVNFSDGIVNNTICRDIEWEELYDSYIDKMKHAMSTIVPYKNLELTAVIAGPKIQLSASSQERLRLWKNTAVIENCIEFSFIINLGNLEVAVWPSAEVGASALAEEQITYNRIKFEHFWLKKPPVADLSREFTTDAYTVHDQIGNNAYLKLENVAGILEVKSDNRQIQLVKPFTVTIQSSVCRDQFNFILTTAKALSANLSITSSAFTIMSSVDDLSSVIQALGCFLRTMSDTLHKFVVSGRDACPSQEPCAALDVPHRNSEDTGNDSKKLASEPFGVVIRPLPTSFAVVFTFELESLDLIFEGSRTNLVANSYQKVAGGSEDGRQYKVRTGAHKGDNIQKIFGLPNMNTSISLQNCSLQFSWGDKKHAHMFLRILDIQAHLSDGTIQTSRRPRTKILESEIRSAKDVSEIHPKVLTKLTFHTCTLNVHAGAPVLDQILQEEYTRNETGVDSSITLQTVYSNENTSSGSSIQNSMMQLDEPTLRSTQSRDQSRGGAVGLLSSTSNCWLLMNLDLSEGFLTDCSLELLISEAMLKSSGDRRIRASFAIGEDFRTVSCDLQGGILVLQTTALVILLQSYRVFQDFLKTSASLFLFFTEYQSARSSEASWISTVVEDGVLQSSCQHAQRKVGVSSQFTFGIHEVDTKRPFAGTLAFRAHQFSLVLATVDASDEARGILLETDLKTTMEIESSKHKVSFDLSSFTILGLHPYGKVTNGKDRADLVPHFGSSSLASCSGDTKELVGCALPSADGTLTGSNASITSKDQVFQEKHSKRSPRRRDRDSNGKDCYILESMTVSFSIERTLAGIELGSWKWRDAWNGQCSISGVDLAFTTSEILMLLGLTSPFSEIFLAKKGSYLEKTMAYENMQTKEDELEPKIPNGAIVAIKDVQEHLYLATENVQNKHHLTGVLHYSLVGDRALFRVKYQEPRTWGKSHSWFSLLSLHARNDDGEPYRVHYRPGSSLVDISSTNDKSWELWRSIPYEYKREEDIEELDIYSHLFQNMVHLINQKSSSGVAFVNGLPMFIKKPGNPIKLKVFSPTALIKSLPVAALHLQNIAPNRDEPSYIQPKDEEKVVLMATVVPHVNVVIENCVITILYEATGAIHFLPLLRVCMDDAKSVSQVSSSKIRVISSFRIMLESYEAQRNRWMEMVRPIEICIVYRARVVPFEQGNAAFEKLPTCFYSVLKKVDLAVSEPSLDICLFLVGELNLAGPFAVKHSPVTANCCKIENRTGLNLLCQFEDKVEAKIAGWQTDSFLIRHMSSRRDLSTVSSNSVTLKLVKSGTISTSPVCISLSDEGVITLRTQLVSSQGKMTAPGPVVVVDVSKQTEDGLLIIVSPMAHIHNASDLSLELRCRRPQQREDDGVVVILRDGDTIDGSMGAFDALNLSGEPKKALSSFNVGNYLLCVRPATTDEYVVENETRPSFNWSEDLKGEKAVRVSGLFDKLNYRIKKTFYGESAQSSFSIIQCGPKVQDSKFKGLHFLVRTTRRKVPVTRTSEHSEPKSSIVAWLEQQEILILPTIRVSNSLELEIAVTLSDDDTNTMGISEHTGSRSIIQGGNRTYLYADLSKLFMTVTLHSPKQMSATINAGDWGKHLHNSKGDLHALDVKLDFGDGKHFAMLRLARGDMGLLEVIIYTPYVLQNDTDMPLLCCTSKRKSFAMWRNDKHNYEWPPSEHTTLLPSKTKISWLEKSDKILIRRPEQNAVVALLDLDLISGFTEISLEVQEETGLKEIVKLGVSSQLASSKEFDPTHTINLVPRYIVVNDSTEEICVCQDGLQEDMDALIALRPGEQAVLHMKILPGADKVVSSGNNTFERHKDAGSDSLLFVQFCLKEPGWSWSGPICSSSLGRFFLKIRRCSNSPESVESSRSTFQEKRMMRFAVINVEEDVPSLVMHFRMHSCESLPYRIDNSLHNASIVFRQKGLTEVEFLEPSSTVGYVWDDLRLSHKLLVGVAGTNLYREINLDKLSPWKSFHKIRQSRGYGLQLPYGNSLEAMAQYGGIANKISDEIDLPKVGYEVYADGPTRVLRVGEFVCCQKERNHTSQILFPYAKIDCRVSYLAISLLEQGKQKLEDSNDTFGYTPVIFARIGNLMSELIITSENTLFQLKAKTLDMDQKWQGAPSASMLRVHGQDLFDRNETVLHMIIIVSNHASNPSQVKCSSILLQAIDLNLDEDTLMKLVPFYRSSLAESTSPSREIYFERFEIHPIKVVASFLPGHPSANYTSAQETLRALLHSVIKVPTIRGTVVELNGVLLSHALVTFRELAIKCAQHYSWYALRAIYIAKGSQLLPPAFASLFDDSASSSLDVFFNPSNGSVDPQRLTIGMFNFLRKGIQKKGYSGTRRYLGDLEHTMKTAGSNVLFAAMREVSDSVLKGAETSGFDGMVRGFRHGILKLAMEPSVLRTAIVKGGSSRRIKLDHSVGMDEMYIEGYLQAMLDALFKQHYLRVKVVDDQVLLKNLPPNSALIDEIMGCVRNFLVGEGLLSGGSSLAVVHSSRRLQAETEWQVGPAFKALCERLFIIFAVRALRKQTNRFLHIDDSSGKSTSGKGASTDQKDEVESIGLFHKSKESGKEKKQSPTGVLYNFMLSSAVAYIDGRLCRHIPNAVIRQIVSGFLLSFVE